MPRMNKFVKIGIVVALVAAAVVVVVIKKSPARPAGGRGAEPQAAAGLPRLVNIGAGMCVPCMLMAPIRDELKKEYEGRLEVVFIDVTENRDAVSRYQVKIIPVQIFFDPSGKELFRHEGFYPKEDIVAKWKELGFDLEKGAPNGRAP